jgi:hypothetical protein
MEVRVIGARASTSLQYLQLAGVLAVAACLVGPPASAHDARPLSVDITQQSADLYQARVRVPPTVTEDDRPSIVWPSNCRLVSDHLSVDPPSPDEVVVVRCGGGLEGQVLRVRYPIYNPSLSTLFRVTRAPGSVLTQVLAPDEPEWRVPLESTWKTVALSYLELGFRHIWTGIDHLLFVTGLLVLAGTWRRVLLTITGFTLAHSLTLSLSASGLVRVAPAPVEAAIALSILFLAYEIARPVPDGLARRYPLLVSSSFGLLHGFGFAAALREVGLPPHELVLGLLCFNLGVEMGQIAFIGVLLALVRPLARMACRASSRLRALEVRRPGTLWGYALGIIAAFWLYQRLDSFY